jgi:hypothetical protein
MKESWKQIKNFEKYEVSNLGRIRNIHNGILKLSANNKGFLCCSVTKNNKKHILFPHREVPTAFIENTYKCRYVNFKDGNRLNCRVSNLEWCKTSYPRESKKEVKEEKTEIVNNTKKLTVTLTRRMFEDIIIPARMNDWAMCKRKIINALKICEELGVNI